MSTYLEDCEQCVRDIYILANEKWSLINNQDPEGNLCTKLMKCNFLIAMAREYHRIELDTEFSTQMTSLTSKISRLSLKTEGQCEAKSLRRIEKAEDLPTSFKTESSPAVSNERSQSPISKLPSTNNKKHCLLPRLHRAPRMTRFHDRTSLHTEEQNDRIFLSFFKRCSKHGSHPDHRCATHRHVRTLTPVR